jgi:hypothetical protein
MFSIAATRGALKPYLNVVDDTLVTEIPPCAISGCGEGVGSNVQKRAISGVLDIERSDRDLWELAMHSIMY